MQKPSETDKDSAPSGSSESLVFPTEDALLRILEDGGALDRKDRAALRLISHSQNRNLQHSRSSYEVRKDDKTLFRIMAGPNLRDLHARAEKFHSAYPSIASRVLFSSHSPEIDIVAFDHFAGVTLESGSVSLARLKSSLTSIQEVLDSGITPSTELERNKELAAFERQVLALPYITHIDRVFLSENVFPLMRRELEEFEPAKRWSNGDFVLRNILVNRSESIRLIDYEFAYETHFFMEDYCRCRYFTSVPSEVLMQIPVPNPSSPGIRVYMWLRQMLLESTIYNPRFFLATLPASIHAVLNVIGDVHSSRAFSTFFSPADVHAQPEGAPPSLWHKASLYFSNNTSFDEKRSRVATYPLGRWCRLTFEVEFSGSKLFLRLDPSDRAGLFELAGFVMKDSSGTTLLRKRKGEISSLFQCGGTGRRIELRKDLLSLDSTGNDPSFISTALQVSSDAAGDTVSISFWLRALEAEAVVGLFQHKLEESQAKIQGLETRLAENLSHAEKREILTMQVDMLQRETASLRRENKRLFAVSQRMRDEHRESSFVINKISSLEQTLEKIAGSVAQENTKKPRRGLSNLPSPVEIFRTRKKKRLEQAEYEVISKSALFSAEYYLNGNPDVSALGQDPLLHFIRHGTKEGRNPSPYFWVNYYLQQYKDVANLGMNPLAHYIAHGAMEGRQPNPFFDSAFYRSTVPGLRESGENPLDHYIRTGSAEGRDPSPRFNIAFYLSKYPDVRSSGIEPLQHFLEAGSKEGRLPAASYGDWLNRYEPSNEQDFESIRDHVASFTFKPFLAMALFLERWMQPSFPDFAEALRTQLFPLSELLLSGPADMVQELARLTLSIAPEISIKITDEDNSPASLLAAASKDSSDYIFLTNTIPILRPDSLYYFANLLQRPGSPCLIYCDEDERDETGVRVNPIFKPALDSELLLQCDYLSSFIAVRPASLASLNIPCDLTWSGTVREATLLLAEETVPEEIHHIPEVAVTKACRTHRDPSKEEEQSIIERVLGRRHRSAATQSNAPRVSIIIPTRNREALLRKCTDGVLQGTDYADFEVVVVDNGSTDTDALDLLANLARHPRVKIIPFTNSFNFSRMVNAGAQASSGDVLLLLNNDIEVIDRNWLAKMVSEAVREEVGCVGAKLLYPDHTIQHAGIVLGPAGMASHAFTGIPEESGGYMRLASLKRKVSAVTGACLAVRKVLFERVRGFDENLRVSFNDVDFCLRLESLGYFSLYLPEARLIHHESASRGFDAESSEKAVRCAEEAWYMKIRWADRLFKDPWYNENLAFDTEAFSLSYPPRKSRPWIDERSVSQFDCLGRKRRFNIYFGDSNEARVLNLEDSNRPLSGERKMEKGLSVIILNKDKPEFIKPLAEQLLLQAAQFRDAGLLFEVLIGDTGSTSPEVLDFYEQKADSIKILRNLRYHFSRCNNMVAAAGRGETFLFLNNDVMFSGESFHALKHMYTHLHSNKGIGCLGAVLHYPDGRMQHMGVDFVGEEHAWGMPRHIYHRQDVDASDIPVIAARPGVTGAFLMIRRTLFQISGGFDERYRRECQDIALCLDVHRLGYKNVCLNQGKIVHVENASRPLNEEDFDDRRRFLRKYGAYIEASFL